MAFHRDAFGTGTAWFLALVIAVAMASHAATSALIIALVAVLALLRLLSSWGHLRHPALFSPVLAVVLGIVATLSSNFALTGIFTLTHGGINFVFARLIDEGIVARYLADNCPDSTIRLCSHRDALPATGDEWLWGDSVLHRELGSWQGFENEARRIVLASLVLYPDAHAKTALLGTLRQFLLVKTGDGLVSSMPHASDTLKDYAPDSFAAYKGARQQRDVLGVEWLNLVHVPAALLALCGLPIVIAMWWSAGATSRDARLAGFILAALVGNAAICGTLSIPSDRYQNRVISLAVLAIMIAAVNTHRRKRASQH
jgi:hypothetical protein